MVRRKGEADGGWGGYRRWLGMPFLLLSLVAYVFGALSFPAYGVSQGGLIRDAEIEGHIRQWVTPLLEAAGLDNDSVSLYLIYDKSLNAFVYGGQNIYLHTAILAEADSSEQVLAVYAHEIGHIAGGHLARMDTDIDNALTVQLLGFLLGLGSIVAGQIDAGAAAISASQHVAQRGLLSTIRKRESAADQAAVRYLESAGMSPRGMVEFMEILDRRSQLYIGNIDPYATTHPLTEERIKTMRHQTLISPHADAPADHERERTFQRIKAKVIGFLYKPEEVYRHYRDGDNSISALYARAIAYFRDHQRDKSFALIDRLIEEEPQNPFFYELKGQFLLESGYSRQAIAYYEQAVSYAPHEPLIRIAYAQALLEVGGLSMVRMALKELELAIEEEKDAALAWQLMSVAQGRLGYIGLSALAQAEKYLILRDYKSAIMQAQRAKKFLKEDEAQNRAHDILLLASSLHKRPI
ncbi:MAG: M48 family metalloprotease [Alphaproteobacteria bacterium GM7ARS4]|nr:M48 family metalloprotease [Alphaproteobacteria bacterium GM7ARS4]